jgi:hypothetical protein
MIIFFNLLYLFWEQILLFLLLISVVAVFISKIRKNKKTLYVSLFFTALFLILKLFLNDCWKPLGWGGLASVGNTCKCRGKIIHYSEPMGIEGDSVCIGILEEPAIEPKVEDYF